VLFGTIFRIAKRRAKSFVLFFHQQGSLKILKPWALIYEMLIKFQRPFDKNIHFMTLSLVKYLMTMFALVSSSKIPPRRVTFLSLSLSFFTTWLLSTDGTETRQNKAAPSVNQIQTVLSARPTCSILKRVEERNTLCRIC